MNSGSKSVIDGGTHMPCEVYVPPILVREKFAWGMPSIIIAIGSLASTAAR